MTAAKRGLLWFASLLLLSGVVLGEPADPHEERPSEPNHAREPDDPGRTRAAGSPACVIRDERNALIRVHFRNGGDELARDLIRRFNQAQPSDPPHDVLLFYMAYTESDTGFQFVRQRFEARSSLSLHDQIRAIDALGETGHPAAIDAAVRALHPSTTPGDTDVARVSPRDFREHLANVLWKVPLATGHVTPEGVAAIRELSAEGWMNAKGGLRTLEKYFDLSTGACKYSPE